MAQGALASLPANGIGLSATTALTAEELREILEYDRIVQFRDAVFAGTHPRVKIPAHLVGKPVPPPLNFLPGNTQRQLPQNESLTQYTPIPHVNGLSSQSLQKASGTKNANSSNSKTEINPIFLQKSDDLIKAEIQLQRQRLERGLREQIEQQRVAAKAAMQTSEALPGFDLSEVLSKALAIVQSSAPVDANGSDGRSSASDSFDERTFYSSQHDTPMSSSSRGRRDRNISQAFVSPQGPYLKPRLGRSDRAQVGGIGLDDSMPDAFSVPQPVQAHQPSTSAQGKRSVRNSPSAVPQPQSFGLLAVNNTVSSHGRDIQTAFSQNPIVPSFVHSQPISTPSIVQGTNQELLGGIANNHHPSPLIRAHDLSPFAPQPARVSPLITTRDVPALLEIQHEGAPPAQVAALRHNASGLSSTDSSPKADKSVRKNKKEKRKGKGKEREKKRKARDNVAASPDSPYIKPEPQSPEPFAPASLPRPQKRPRQSGQFSAGLTYDEPEILDSRTQLQNLQSGNRNYSRNEARYGTEQARPERVYRGEQTSYRERGLDYVERVQSPLAAPLPAPAYRSTRAASRAVIERPVTNELHYHTGDASRASIRPEIRRNRSRSPIMGNVEVMPPPLRRSVMRVVVDEYGNERYLPVDQSPYQRETTARASIRPNAVRQISGSPVPRDYSPILMAPPKRSMRVLVDEFGREYLEPVQEPVVTRRYREYELPYERAVSRVVSTRTPADAFEEGGVTYRQAPAPLARRVMTQPEYVQEDVHKAYRQREYSVRPAGEGESFVEIRAPERRRVVSHYDEPIREVIRQSTVRPEAVRYEIPREYTQRAQSVRPGDPASRVYVDDARSVIRREVPPQGIREYSVRPDGPPHEYATSVRPEGRREVIPHGEREYSVRPVQRRPVYPDGEQQYYEEMTTRRPAEMVYVERPSVREGSVMVYADDVRRDVYR